MKRTLYYLLGVMLLLMGISPTMGKDFKIKQVDVYATIEADGSVLIEEERTYRFEGSFSWANYEMPRKGFEEMEVLSVEEVGGIPYFKGLREDGEDDKLHTYTVRKNKKRIEIKWFYKAKNETKTFLIAYRLKEAIVVGPEYSEFFWTFLSRRWEKKTEKYNIWLRFERNATEDQFWTSLRSPQGTQLSIQDDSTGKENVIHVSGTNLHRRKQVKLRTVFSNELLTNPQVTDTDYSLASAQANEARYQQKITDRKAREKKYEPLGMPLGLGIMLSSLIVFVVVYMQYGRNPELIGVIPDKLYKKPSDATPAMVHSLVSMESGKQLIITLLDLARQGYFTVIEQERASKYSQKRYEVTRTDKAAEESLSELERITLIHFERELKQKPRYLHKLMQYPHMTTAFRMEFKRQLKADIAAKGWHDEESKKIATYHGLAQLLLIIINAVAIFALTPSPWFVGAVFVTAMMLLCSLAIPRLTEAGVKEKKNWQSFNKGLKFGALNQFSSVAQSELMLLAIAFNLNKRTIEGLFDADLVAKEEFAWLGGAVDGFHPTQITGAIASVSSAASAGAAAGAAGGGAGGGAG